MFRKTKRRIVLAIVISLLALMAVTLATIWLSNRAAMRREYEEMLRAYTERYSLEGGTDAFHDDRGPGVKQEGAAGEISGQMTGETPGEMTGVMPGPRGDMDPMKNEPRFRLSTFYSVAWSGDGEVLRVDSGNSAIYSEDEVLKMAASILEGGKESGSEGSIYYLVSKLDSCTLVAMIDSTIGDSDQQMLIGQMLIIGSAAMLILCAASIFLARRIVRPLEESDERQRRFVSDAGHELKTPIAVISANTELIRRSTGESEWLDNIDYENERMSDLVKQLLELSRAERSGAAMEAVDLSRLVSGETLPFETLAFEKGVAIEAQIEEGVYVKGDAGQLRQLVSILLDNALSHGSGDLIELSLRRDRHQAVLEVTNAAQLSDGQLPHIFERFYRADEARSAEGAHYGLGLSIAKAVATGHGGAIRAESRDGKAVFTVTLPIIKK